MSELMTTYRGVVYPWHCDHMGHMNVMWYTGKFDEASWQLLSQLGLTQARFSLDGTGLAAVEQHTEYKRELRAGDAITIRSTLLEMKEKSIRMMHEMRNDVSGEVAAITNIVGIYFDTTVRKSIPLPADVREAAKREEAAIQKMIFSESWI
jgi:acyl-CoA thioester hydrolase